VRLLVASRISASHGEKMQKLEQKDRRLEKLERFGGFYYFHPQLHGDSNNKDQETAAQLALIVDISMMKTTSNFKQKLHMQSITESIILHFSGVK
jgi:hypothetical protein